jgi:hypothetical protein
MRDRRAARWVVAVATAALLGAVGVLLLRAPVPAVSGPTGAGPAGPHTHVMAGPSGAVVPVGGTATAAGGYALVVTATSPFTFHVQGPDGAPVTRFAVVHDQPLHLIVVRQDLTGYQHVHPAMAPDGTWTAPLRLPAPGPYRAYADFAALDPAGRQNAVVLGTDIPSTAAAPAPSPSTVDDLAIRYDGRLTVGVAEPLLFRVTRAGAPVTLRHRVSRKDPTAAGGLGRPPPVQPPSIQRQEALGAGVAVEDGLGLTGGKGLWRSGKPGPGPRRWS